MCCLCSSIFSQQIHMYDQTYLNNAIYNPAYTGFTSTYDVFFLRNQRWGDFDGGSISNLVLFDAPFKKNNGFGFNFSSSKTGVISTNSLLLNYAQAFKINKNQSIRFGIGVGILDSRIDFANLVVSNLDDPLLLQNSANSNTSFNSSFGVYYNFDRLEIGFSMPQLFTSSGDFSDGSKETNYNYLIHYMASVKYNFMLMDNDLSLSPVLYTRYIKNVPFQYDFGFLSEYKNSFWLGLTYKSDYAIAANVGYIFKNMIRLGYVYEVAINNNRGSNINQEFVLGVSLLSKRQKESDINLDSINEAHKQQLYSKQLVIDSLNNLPILTKFDTIFVESTIVDTVYLTFEKPSDKDSSLFKDTLSFEAPIVEITDSIYVLNSSETVQRSYYVVSGAFSEIKNAYASFENVDKNWFPDVQIFFNNNNNLYYIVLDASLDLQEIKKTLLKSYEASYIDAWILKYNPNIYLID